MTNESSTSQNNPVVVRSDEELVTEFCLANKVSKTATEELLKRGFTSLEALKLVEMDNLSSEKIPKGQRRLIMHITRALLHQDAAGSVDGTAKDVLTSETADARAADANSSSAGATIGTAANAPVQITQEVEPEVAVQNCTKTSNEQSDVYSSLIHNLISHQKTFASAQKETVTPSQPSWNDPQIHISSASGKSVSGFLDICDFVQCSVEEEVVLGGQGDQQIVVKSGPKKPKLESLTLSQWSVANLSILYKLVNENKLIGPALMDYLLYTTKVYQLVQRFSLVSVLLFDREYRKLQSSMGFRWSTDVQHFHMLFLQARSQPASQASQQTKKGTVGQKPGWLGKEKEICRNFNSSKGCSFQNCKFQHTCLLPGCSQKHPVQTHKGESKNH